MSETVIFTDEEMVIEVLNFFYPNDPISEHQLNAATKDLAAVMYAEALEKSEIMHLVPRPGGRPNFKWLAKQAVKATWRSIKDDNDIYDTVKNRVALNFKSAYAMAKAGI